MRQEAKQREQFEAWNSTRQSVAEQRKAVDAIVRRRLRLTQEDASYRRQR